MSHASPEITRSAKEQAAYDKAVERIETCLNGRGLTLNLCGLGLETVPPEIGQLTWLESLDLGANRLTSLPAEFWRLTCLIELHLDGNQLVSLPPEIGQFAQLER